MNRMKFFSIIVLWFVFICSIEAKANLTLDTFFNYTSFRSISLSPNGEHLLIHTRRAAWESNVFKNSLWLYQVNERRSKLLTDQLLESVKLQWSPSGNWIVFLLNNNTVSKSLKCQQQSNSEQYLHLYSIKSDQTISIPIGAQLPLAISWSQNDSSLYYATINVNSTAVDESEWKDIVPYRQSSTCSIQQVTIDSQNGRLSMTTHIVDISFLISELLYSPSQDKLFLTSVSPVVEDAHAFQIYSINLKNVSEIIKLTSDPSLKLNLQLAPDRKRLMYLIYPIGKSEGSCNTTQQRLHSIDLTDGVVERWASDFQGSIVSYSIKSIGGVYFLGQLGTNVHAYSQMSLAAPSVLQPGLNGTYDSISSSATNSVAFIFSSFSKAQEAYLISNITDLKFARAVTNENNQFDQINLPEAEPYQWKNADDNRTIEGVLYYPPGKFHEKNLPLLVLIHGGPSDASLNYFLGNWYTWAPMAAATGWAVLAPNYRGSTGYGDVFAKEIELRSLTLPGRDVLSGVDQLIKDGIADRTKLSIGGYSYGGFLTNWLITQTTQFNAALSGAGAVEQVSMWGMTDFPVIADGLEGGFPWEKSEIYERESAIYQFDKIRTPTHIVSGAVDTRVPVSQNMMLERALRYLGIPVNLLLLPDEGHPLSNNPWHGKIKVREELKWLEMYGYRHATIKN